MRRTGLLPIRNFLVEMSAIASIDWAMASQDEASTLSFTDNLDQAVHSGNDIWMAAGSLHYFENARPVLHR